MNSLSIFKFYSFRSVLYLLKGESISSIVSTVSFLGRKGEGKPFLMILRQIIYWRVLFLLGKSTQILMNSFIIFYSKGCNITKLVLIASVTHLTNKQVHKLRSSQIQSFNHFYSNTSILNHPHFVSMNQQITYKAFFQELKIYNDLQCQFRNFQEQFQQYSLITMYKYTYLLSDSYRQQPTGHPSDYSFERRDLQSHSFTNQATSKQPFYHVSNPLGNPMNNRNIQFRQEKYQENISSLSTLQPLEKTSVKFNPKTKQLENRLKKLDDLSDRHNEALREVDLQTKLQQISDKYSGKKPKLQRSSPPQNNSSTSTYEQYKNQKKNILQHNYSFNKMPDMEIEKSYQNLPIRIQENDDTPVHQISYNRRSVHQRPQIPNLDITKTAIKELVNVHLSKGSFQKQQFFPEHKRYEYIKLDENRPPEQDRPKMEDTKTVDKLSSLQERIKSSIKPYLNM